MSELFGYFNQAKDAVMPKRIDSEGQLKAAQAAQRGFSAQQNAEARKAGFRDAAAHVDYLRQRQIKTGGTVAGQKKLNIRDALAWHPANTIGGASNALAAANGD